jgi:chromosomal replication initiation ATPase DnaA
VIGEGSIGTEEVLEKVAKKFNVESKRLLQKGERGLEARNGAMWMIWESGSKSLREIGELFSGLDYAAVAQRIRRTRSAHDAQTKRKLLKEMLNVET